MNDATSARTLELRIHGVNNTAPADMLGLGEDQIERLVGDDLGGFWRAKPDVLDRLAPGDRGYTPPTVHREAYSWGGLARNSVGVADSGFIASVSRAFIRIGWVLLLPFGLCNVAYWSRRLRGGEEPALAQAAAAGGVSSRSSAGMTRLFGLALTLLSVFTACEVAMDLIATQCYGNVEVGGVPRSNVQLCENLPSWFDLLRREPPVRLVIASVVPLLILVGLYYLSAVSRFRYERVTSAAYKALGESSRPAYPIIATPGFWSSTRMTSGLARLHLAAGVAGVTVALAGPALFGAGEACDIRNVGHGLGPCWDQIADDPERSLTYAPLLILALFTIAAAALLIWHRTSDAPDLPGSDDVAQLRRTHRWTFLVLVGSVMLLVWTAAFLLLFQPTFSDDISLPGVNAAPTLLAIVLTGLAWGALTWRFDRMAHLWTFVIIGGLLAAVLWEWAALVVAGAAAVVLVRMLRMGGEASAERRSTAWRGGAPGILLGGSLIAALTMASLVILVTGDWLNGRNNAATLISGVCPEPAEGVVGTAHPCLVVPTSYVLFGGAMAVALVILTVVLIAVLFKTARGRSIGVDLALEPEPVVPVPPFEQSLRDARRWAGCAHRAEKLIAVLVMMGMAAILLMLGLAAAGWIPDFEGDNLAGWVAFSKRVVGGGTLAFAFVGLLLVGAAIGGKGKQRPLGLLWDLVCFLPRAAHPFAPPCYAERAVPEIVGRCDWWLQATDEKGVDGRRGDTIVLSAHSLGSVLAVASLFSMTQRPAAEARPQTYRLITYGSQLRSYFGRIFPELLGPTVLGISPVSGGRLWTIDPWQSEVGTAPTDLDADTDTLVNRLRDASHKPPRWRNLWRRTDYLGFPVHAYQPNVIDVRASEVDETGYQIVIGTHSDYPNTPEYWEALALLTPKELP